jgi:carbon monoxide dehydrogenase subunit G
MAGFMRQIQIDRPRAEVFAFATNLEKVPQWLPEVVRVEKLTDGPIRAGTQFRETRLMKGKEHSAIIDVSEHEPPRVHAASSSCFGILFTYRYRFEPKGGGTRIHLEALANSKWYAAPFVGMMLKMMEKMDGDQLEKLKAAIENGSA